MRLLLLATLVLLSSAGAAGSRVHAACPATTVRYRTAATSTPDGVAGVPWLASTNAAFRAYLFYLGGTRWAHTHPRAAHIFTTRAHVRVHPKVLWVALGPTGSSLTIRGTRLDAPGSFRTRYPSAIGGGSGAQFPSYVRVPAAGCWRVDLRSGRLHGTVTFVATDAA